MGMGATDPVPGHHPPARFRLCYNCLPPEVDRAALRLPLVLLAFFVFPPICSAIDLIVDNDSYSIDFTNEAQVLDFCRLSSMTDADCHQLLEAHRLSAEDAAPPGTLDTASCPTSTSIYIVPMGSKIHNFGAEFNLQPSGAYKHTNPDAPDWLMSIMNALALTRPLGSNVSVQIVPPWRAAQTH